MTSYDVICFWRHTFQAVCLFKLTPTHHSLSYRISLITYLETPVGGMRCGRQQLIIYTHTPEGAHPTTVIAKCSICSISRPVNSSTRMCTLWPAGYLQLYCLCQLNKLFNSYMIGLCLVKLNLCLNGNLSILI